MHHRLEDGYGLSMRRLPSFWDTEQVGRDQRVACYLTSVPPMRSLEEQFYLNAPRPFAEQESAHCYV